MTNPKQDLIIKEAITPAAVIAGPGTGKTFTIVKKVVDLVKNHGVEPNKILLTTFTKKAAHELNTRILTEFKRDGINESLANMKIGNFHGIARIYLDDYSLARPGLFKPDVIDSHMEAYLLDKNIGIFENIEGFKKRFYGNVTGQIQGIFESITNNLIDLEVLKNSSDQDDRLAYEVYTTHLNFLRENNLTNFQLLLKDFYDLLSSKDYGDEIRAGIDYVIIDEYQDTNYIQQEIAFNLLKNDNILVFGDDDQSLYSFRGADPKNLTNFSKVCEEKLGKPANFYRLDINYRSNQEIIDLASKWMDVGVFDELNKKSLKSVNEDINPNSVVRARAGGFENLIKIIGLLKNQVNLNQIAFLFPTLNSAYSKQLERFLEENGLAVINHGASNFFNRREIRILVYIYTRIFTSYPSNLESYPHMGYEEEQKLKYRTYLASLFDDDSFKTADLDDFINYCKAEKIFNLTAILYMAFKVDVLREILSQELGKLEADRSQHNIALFTSLVADYEEMMDKNNPSYHLEFIYGYLYHFFKRNSIKEYDELDGDYEAINFMTIHDAKGLEFEVVFVSGLNDYPRGDKAKLLSQYEKKEIDKVSKIRDFYRKYYTAFTRAQNLLVLLDNSRDDRLIELADSLNSSSNLSSLEFIRREKSKDKPIFAFTTHIEVYDSCPLKYKFMAELGFKLRKTDQQMRGSLIHELAEAYSKNKQGGISYNLIGDKYQIDPSYQRALDSFINRDFEVKATEVNYKADRDFYVLQGNIDIILADDSIMDIKTGTYNEKTLEKYNKQVLTYNYLRELNQEETKNLYLYFIENDEIVEVDKADFNIENIDEIAKNIIDRNIYEKTADIRECKYCPMQYYCGRN